MARKRQGKLLPMVKFREIIRLHELGRNQTEIARSCGVSRSTVQDYTRRADAKRLSYAVLCELSDSEAQALLGKQTGAPVPAKEMDFSSVHKELSHRLSNVKVIEVSRQSVVVLSDVFQILERLIMRLGKQNDSQ